MNDVEILFIINILIGLCFFLIIKNYVKMGKELNKTYDFEDKDYRDIPNELNATPARALFIMDNDLSLENEKIFSATMFDLCLKDVIQFEVVDSRNVNISIKNKYNILLPEDEKIIYDILLKAMGDRNSISLKEFQSYYEVRSREFFQTLRSVEGAAKEYQRECGNIDLEKEKKMKKFSRRFIIYIIIFSIYISQMEFVQYISNDLLRDAIIMAIKYVPVIYIGLLVTATVCKYNASNSNLSEKGIKEASQWSALYKYIDRYLTVNETNSRGIKVYEKILVYATVFGISQKMINNLQIIHPEIFAKDDKITTYKYWNFVCTNIDGKNSFNIIRDELEKVCNKIIEINNNIGYSDKK